MNASEFSLPLLHGAVGIWDEVVIYGGLGLIVLTMVALSWRAGRRRKKRREQSRPQAGTEAES